MKLLMTLVFFTLTLFAQNLEVKSKMSYFEQKDVDKNIDITQEKFLQFSHKYSNFGFTNSIYWLKIELENISTSTQQLVLHFPYTLLDYIDIYELINNELIIQRKYGDLRAYINDGHIPDPSFIFSLKANESKTYYFKMRTEGSMNIELLLNTYDDFTKYSLEKSIVFSFYFGAIFIMLIYNFILYLFIKDKSYLYYLLFHINYLFFLLSLHGLTFSNIWPQTPSINTFIVPLFMSICSSIAVIFTIEFLNIKALSPRLYKPLIALFWINILMTFITLLLSYHYASIFSSLLSLASIVIILSSSIYSHFISKNQNAKFFALAWGMLLMGIFIVHFRNLGLLPVNVFTSYSPFIGAFFELTLLSIALAYRYNIQREEIVTKDTILYKQSRLASMGEMLSNIAHQWRQPLNRVNIGLAVINEVIQKEHPDHELIQKKIKNSEKNIQYMSQTIDDFAEFFAPDKKRVTFKVYDAVEKSLNLIESRLGQINIHTMKDKNIELYGFENEYVQIILVILNNALDNFEITQVKQRDIYISIQKDKDDVTLNIRDNSGGIKDEHIEHIFDPYYTTKFKKEGTGIGLYMAKMLIENSMHGELKVSSHKDESTFMITIRIDS